MLRVMASRIARFLNEDDGPTAVEYAVMLALIVVVSIAAITALVTNADLPGQSPPGSSRRTSMATRFLHGDSTGTIKPRRLRLAMWPVVLFLGLLGAMFMGPCNPDS